MESEIFLMIVLLLKFYSINKSSQNPDLLIPNLSL